MQTGGTELLIRSKKIDRLLEMYQNPTSTLSPNRMWDREQKDELT